MSILQIKTDFAGQASVNPRLVRIVTNDDLSTVTSLNWLKEAEANGYPILPTDFLAIAYSDGSGWFVPNIDLNGNITLVSIDSGGGGGVTVEGSVTPGNIVQFASSSSISDVGFKIVQGISPDFMGGDTFFTFAAPGVVAFSNVLVTIRTFNNAGTTIITAGSRANDSIEVEFNQDPGVDTSVNYVAFS